MFWILDLIIVLIIGIFVFVSAKHGFARTVIELVGYFLAIYLAFTIGGLLADVIYDSAIVPAFVERIAEKITVSADANVGETVNNIWSSLPGIVVNTAENFNITVDTLRETITQNLTNSANTVAFAETAANSVVRPILVPIVKALIGFILFILLMFVVKILSKIINKVFCLPLIGGLNKFLGGIIGLLKGAIVSIVFVTVVLLIMSFFEDGFLIFTNDNIEQSILFKFFAGFSPFK